MHPRAAVAPAAAPRPQCLPPYRAPQNANRLRVLPPSIGALTGMVRLSLHINQLEHLPPELGNLTQLEALRWVQQLQQLAGGGGAPALGCVMHTHCLQRRQLGGLWLSRAQPARPPS